METKDQTNRSTREELEFSIGWIENNPGLYARQIRDFHANHSEGWTIAVNERPGFLTVIAERVGKGGWLRSGSLLYRLTNEPRPQNRDEINVTMAQGSREADKRERRARQLKEMLETSHKINRLSEALKWALEWIDAVPQDTLLPGMPGFDRDYVNSLLKD